jgi:hypothetical protein
VSSTRPHLKSFAFGLWLGATAIVAPLRTGQSQTTTPCLGPDSVSKAWLVHLDSLLTETDSVNVSWRSKLGLRAVADSQIALITTRSICQTAVGVVDSLVQHRTPNRKLYVFRLGNQWAVWDPASGDMTAADGTLRRLILFGAGWAYKSTLVF